MKLKSKIIILIIGMAVLGSANSALAGFGISPPWIINEHAVPGSHFEKKITISQEKADKPLRVTVIIDGAVVKDWIKIKQSDEFIIPAGARQFPVNFIIDVPEDTDYGFYEGKISFRATPPDAKGGGQVTVALGAQADIKIKVTGDEFYDFKIMTVTIPELEEAWPVKIVVKLQNLGNVKVKPSKVSIDIYDDYRTVLLGSKDITEMSPVNSFVVGESAGELPIKLDVGRYWGEVKVYKMGDLVFQDKLRFSVVPKWTFIKKPLLKKIGDFITASTLRIIVFTFLVTLLLIAAALRGTLIYKKYKKKYKNRPTRKS